MIKRELYLSKIRLFYDSDLIKVLVGIRRCGKSVILKQIIQELLERNIDSDHIIYLNFELLDYAQLTNEQALFQFIKKKIVDQKKYYLLFDEIQSVENFEKAINSFRADLNVSIFITGSNGRLLSGELATFLSGRYVEFKILPFSYAETCQFLTLQGKKVNENTFLDYLKWGGMPQRFSFENEEQIKIYLTDLYNSIILKDVVQRAKVKNIALLEKIIQFLLDNLGQIFSASSVVKFLRNEKRTISTETIYNYLYFLTNSLIFNCVNRYDLKGKKILSTLDKYFVADLGIKQIKKTEVEFKISGCLENIVYNELISLGYIVYIGKIYQKEIDFIAVKADIKKYFQVTYLLNDEKIIQREFDVYQTVNDSYPKYVISMDKVDFSRNGVIHLNIVDFLLKKDW